MAALAPVDPPLPDFESDDEYHWDGDEYRAEYSSVKVNTLVAHYSLSCSHVTLVASASSLDMSLSPLPASQPHLSPKLIHLLGKLSLMPVNYPHPHGPFAVADTGATNHMIPDNHASSATSRCLASQFARATIHLFWCWAVAPPYSPSMASASWSEMFSTFLG
jgi:hypothetical protein